MKNVIDFNTSKPVDFTQAPVVEIVCVPKEEFEHATKIVADEYKKSRRFISVEQGYYLLGYICGIAVAELL